MRVEQVKPTLNVLNKSDTLPANSIFAVLESKSYVMSATCVLEHIIFTTDLTSNEKLFYLVCDTLANIELNSPKRSGKRHLRISITALSTLLGIDRRTVVRFQKSLSDKGYLLVEKGGVDARNRQQRNLLTPVLPEAIFEQLNLVPNRAGVEEGAVDDLPWGPRALLDETKLFVRANFNMLHRVILSKRLSATSKLLWLYCYTRSYINYQNDNTLVFHETVVELAEKSSISQSSIRNSLKQLCSEDFISFEEYKKDLDDSFRKEHRILIIAASLPNDVLRATELQPNRKNSVLQGIGAKVGQQNICLDHHQKQKSPYETSIRSPLCIKHLIIKPLVNKHIEEGPVDNNETANVEGVASRPTVINDTKNKTNKAEALVECLESNPNHVLTNDEKTTLTLEAHRVYNQVDSMLNAWEALETKEPKTFDEFLAPLSACEKFLYQQIGIDSGVLDAELLAKLQSVPEDAPLEASSVPTGSGDKDYPQALHETHCQALGADAVQHITNYISKLHQNKDIHGHAQATSLERLIMEVTHFVATWVPNKTFSGARDKRLFQLSVAGGKLRSGKWTIPPAYVAADRAQVQFNLQVEKTRNANFH